MTLTRFTFGEGLTARVANASLTANASDLIIANAGGITVTLPSSPAFNTQVGVICTNNVSSASPMTVAGGGGNIYGGGISLPASNFPLSTPGAAVMLQFDGTNWAMVSGFRDGGIVNAQLAVAAQRLVARVVGGSVTANASDLIVVTTSNTTVTLPASPAVNTLIGVINASNITGASPTTIAASGGVAIYGGGFVTTGPSFPLGMGGASVTLQFDGTNWAIIAGQQDSGWKALTLSGPSPTAGFYTPAARLLGNMVYIRGACTNGGSSIPAGTAFANVPAGMAPANTVQPFPSGSLQIKSDATLSFAGGPISGGTQIALDDIFYSIA